MKTLPSTKLRTGLLVAALLALAACTTVPTGGTPNPTVNCDGKPSCT